MTRRFNLVRYVDHTGVSGVGNVAEGVMFSDGSVVLHWFGEHSSIVVWRSLDDAIAVHGHNGATRVEWVDVAETGALL